MISAIFIFKTNPRKLQNTDRTGQNEPFVKEMVMVSDICHIFLVILFSKQNHPLELQNTIPYIKFGFFMSVSFLHSSISFECIFCVPPFETFQAALYIV
jgi:hypothetical protein